jgi:hypothetical protein
LRPDSRSAHTWDVSLTAKPGQRVTLTWPGVERVPREWSLKLVDKRASVTRSMRTQSRYVFVMDETGSRSLQIVAEPGGVGALLVTDINASGTRARGSAVVSYTLSSDADANITIRSLSGKLVRRLASTRAAAGVNSQVWDFKDTRGRFVPRGMYLCEVRVRNDEGETSRGVGPLLVR